jgi:hypothetical protein
MLAKFIVVRVKRIATSINAIVMIVIPINIRVALLLDLDIACHLRKN